jgi:hypothetical protein
MKLSKEEKQQRKSLRKQRKAGKKGGRRGQPAMGVTTPPGVPIPGYNPMIQGPPNAIPAIAGQYPCGADLGWPALLNAIAQMAASGRWGYSLDGQSEIMPLTAYPQLHMHPTAASIQVAARLALQGRGGFNLVSASAPSPVVADLTATIGAIPSFGLRIGLTNNITSFKFAIYKIQVLDSATVQTEFFVKVPRIPMDIIVLSVNNANGKMSIVQNASPVVKIIFADSPALTAGDTLTVATLTMRDLGVPPNAVSIGGIA